MAVRRSLGRRAGRRGDRSSTSGSASRSQAAPLARDRDLRARSHRSSRRRAESRSASLVVGASPRRAIDDDYRQFAERVASHTAAVLANAKAYEDGAPPRRGAGGARSREDRVLLEREPRVPHAAHPACSARPRTRWLVARSRAAWRAARASCTATQLRLLKLVNTLLDFSRIEAGRMQRALRAHRPRALTADLASAFRSAIERARARTRGRLSRRSPSPSTSTATCGRRSSSTCCRTR